MLQDSENCVSPPTGHKTAAAEVSVLSSFTVCFFLAANKSLDFFLSFFFLNGRITEGTNMSHLDKVQHGYENMEHFTVSVERQRRALANVDFIKGAERLTSLSKDLGA